MTVLTVNRVGLGAERTPVPRRVCLPVELEITGATARVISRLRQPHDHDTLPS
jgi:hypothetical protein